MTTPGAKSLKLARHLPCPPTFFFRPAARTGRSLAAAGLLAMVAALSLDLASAPTWAAPVALDGKVAGQMPSATELARSADAVMSLRSSVVAKVNFSAPPNEPFTTIVPIGGQAMTLDLRPHTLRAAGYQLLAQVEDGSLVEVDPGPDQTYRGTVRGLGGSTVAGGMMNDGLHLLVRMQDGERWWAEPIFGRVPGAERDDYVIYNGRDVIPSGGTCGVEADGAAVEGGVAGGGVAGTKEGICVTQLACDADFEFFQDYGSVISVQNRINAVINAMNVQYETEVGITHTITTILVRTAEPDPYTSTSAGTLLNQLRNQWNAAHGSIQRDVVQLFTGKNIDGSTIGIAQLGVVCNISNAYSLVQSDCCGGLACTTDLSAHELGHNWSGQHCSCPSYTMNPSLTCVNTFHPTLSVPQIVDFRDTRTCLDCVPFCGEVRQLAKVTASDAGSNDQLGRSIGAFSAPAGNRVVVGSPLDNIGATSDAGSAYVYRMGATASSWVQEQKLQASDLAASDQFGTAVAMDGDYLVVGSPLDNNGGGTDAGSAYVFIRSGTSWTQQAKLVASDPGASDEFGHAVSISGDRVIVGSWKDDNGGGADAGAAYVFRRSGTTWTQEVKLTASDFALSDQFGGAVGISGVYAIVGAALDDHAGGANAGSAYIYIRSGTSWTQQAKLVASDAAANDNFASSVSIGGDYAAAGAPMEDNGAGIDAGSAYVYLRNGTTWPQQAKILAITEPAAGQHFGRSVANTPDYLMVGAPDATVFGVSSGAAYVFLRGGTAWSELARVNNADGSNDDDFGASVSLSALFAVAGAPLDSLGGTSDAGSAYVFSRPGPDCNANGIPDECDVSDGTSADCNSNGLPDECDIAAGTSSDINANGIPDECEPDCNSTGTPNSFDIATGTAEDCNGNGVPDSCDITNRTSADCNDNGVPDECEDALVSLISPQYSPFGVGFAYSFLITDPLPATDAVTLTLTSSTDYGFASETVVIKLNGVDLATIFGTAGHDCAKPPDTAQITVPAATWNAAAGTGAVTISMTPAAAVSPTLCPAGSFIFVTISYSGQAPLDADGDGVIDTCDGPPTIPADFTGDGHVNGLDLAILLASWTGSASYSPCPPPTATDLNGDCMVNGIDLGILLASWG